MRAAQPAGTRPFLKLLRSDEYEAGEALAARNGLVISDEGTIDAALSLYFQWPEYRAACIYSSDRLKRFDAQVSVDEDEALPTEIYLLIKDAGRIDHLLKTSEITFSLEVFNVAYVMTAKILSAEVRDNQELLVVVAIPASITSFKIRSIPRHKLDKNQQSDLPAITFSMGDGKAHILKLNELSPRGLRGEMECLDESVQSGTITIGNNSFQVQAEKRGNKDWVFKLRFESRAEFGKYFDFYVSRCHPSLRPRSSVDSRQLYDTYKSTGFFDKYVNTSSPDEEGRYFNSLSETWAGLKDVQHEACVDYVSMSKTSNPVGASSLVRAFKNGQRDVWIITQLCTVAEPEYFPNTNDLYLWRAAYLVSMPGDADVTCWIDGNSRFLERVWVKFLRHSGQLESNYWPVTVRVLGKADASAVKGQRESVAAEAFGEFERKSLVEDGQIAAVDPSFLNFGRLCDHVASVPPGKMDANSLRLKAASLVEASSERDCQVRITTTQDNHDAAMAELPKILLNRFCYFKKEDCSFLYASIQHSLAIMERKQKKR